MNKIAEKLIRISNDIKSISESVSEEDRKIYQIVDPKLTSIVRLLDLRTKAKKEKPLNGNKIATITNDLIKRINDVTKDLEGSINKYDMELRFVLLKSKKEILDNIPIEYSHFLITLNDEIKKWTIR